MKRRVLFTALLFLTLACRPVLSIGWGEIVILVVLIAFLAGPAIFKLYRRLAQYKKAWKDSK